MRGITLFLLSLLVLSGFLYWYFGRGYRLSFPQSVVVVPTLTPATSAALPSTPFAPDTLPPQIVHSPDGTKKLTVAITPHTNGSATYTVEASDISGSNQIHIFTTDLPRSESLSIPDNAWSPDNMYLFLKESTTQGEQVFVFHSNGEPFANGKGYLDVAPLFAARDFAYTFVDATGWADSTLIILLTSTKDGSKGPLFWFVIPSSGFLQLAR